MMIVQIYEVGTPEEARQIVEAGVDHIGVLVGEGEFPREQSCERAREIFAQVPPPAKKVALSLSHDVVKISEIIETLHPDILHLGALPELLRPETVKGLKNQYPQIGIMRSLPVTGDESIGLAKAYDGVAHMLLLDSHVGGDTQIGATGVTHDWHISKHIIESVSTPVILAGGLGPENVAEAIRATNPFGVDSKTRTDKERSHEKDIQKVRLFCVRAKSA